jgi:DNA replication regulator SLD3
MKKPNRPSTIVKATPVNDRYKDALAGEKHPPAADHPTPRPDIVPPSSASIVPASTLPRKFTNRLSSDASSAIFADRIQATPARGGTGLGTVEETPQQPGGVLPSSPIMARRAAPQQQPPGPSSTTTAVSNQAQRRAQFLSIPKGDEFTIPSSPGPMGLDTLFETPLAPRERNNAAAVAVDDTPIKSRLPLGTALDGGNSRTGSSATGGVIRWLGGGDGAGSLGSSGIRMKQKLLGAGGARTPQPQPQPPAVGRRNSDGLGSDDGARVGGGLNENISADHDKKSGAGNGSSGSGGGNGLSIYQRLGWDTTDLDDIDDLL